ncbi:hypothetical protein HPB51_004929 [Rhipicephalus microplus]|uniref:Uncharacterized protein n=1 Tax=Rhipicephalus microplus TaxID=6941 RepID=A0A9J6EFT1_RHIMP|nr:hypothetical protein HPB51_004929 [Rhipicephalus microplus]
MSIGNVAYCTADLDRSRRVNSFVIINGLFGRLRDISVYCSQGHGQCACLKETVLSVQTPPYPLAVPLVMIMTQEKVVSTRNEKVGVWYSEGTAFECLERAAEANERIKSRRTSESERQDLASPTTDGGSSVVFASGPFLRPGKAGWRDGSLRRRPPTAKLLPVRPPPELSRQSGLTARAKLSLLPSAPTMTSQPSC